MNILKEGVRSAFVRIIRIFVYLLLFIVVSYILGLITSKKASALVFKTSTYETFSDGTTRSGSVNAGSGDIKLTFTLQNQSFTSTYDLVALRINRFSFNFQGDNNSTSYDSCSGSYDYDNASSSGRDIMSWSCTTNSSGTSPAPQDSYYRLFAYAVLSNGYSVPCWESAEISNTFLCPVYHNDYIRKFEVHINYNTPLTFTYDFNTSGSMNFFNYENTDIINGQGQIVNQQTITNNYLQDNNTNNTQSNGTTALNGIQSTMESKLKGTNELTQMVLSPITILSTISSSSCQPITWNIPLVNYQATIPCMSTIYNQYFSGIITLFSTIITGVFAYRTVVKLVSTLKDCLDAENDKIEVIDL